MTTRVVPGWCTGATILPMPISYQSRHAPWQAHAGALALLAVVLLLHAAVNAWWLRTDNLPRMGDDAQHAVFAHGILTIATKTDWSLPGRVRALLDPPTGIYPPLFHYAAAASGALFGPTRAGFAAVNTIFLAVLAALVYTLGTAFLRPRFALLAAATCTALPLVAGSSRLCITDLLTAVWAAAGLLALIHADGFHRRGPALAFGAVVGLGLLTRWMLPLYLAAPALVAFGIGALRRDSWARPAEHAAARRRWWITLTMAGALVIVIAAPWYAPRIAELRSVHGDYFRPMDGPSPFHTGSVDIPGAAATTPTRAAEPLSPPMQVADFGPWETRTWATYALLLNNKALFLPTSLLALAGLIVALTRARRDPRIGVVLAAILGTYIILTAFWAVRAPAPRYVLPMLPALALLPAIALQAIPAARWRTIATALFCGWLLLQFAQLSIASIPRLAYAALPVFQDHPYVRDTNDQGLALWAAQVNAGGARIGPPYTGRNWIDEVYAAMTAHEITTMPSHHHQANVMLAGALKPSLESLQHEHWPRRNPLDPASPRVRAVISPLAPIASGTRSPGEALSWPSPQWVDAVTVASTAPSLAWEWRTADGVWHPAAPVSPHDGFGIAAFPRIRATALRLDPAAPCAATLSACRLAPQPRPFVLIEHADAPSDWPLDRVSVADYLVVVSPVDHPVPVIPDAAFHVLTDVEAPLLGYWEPGRVTVYARNQPRAIAFDTPPGLSVRVLEAGATEAGRWDIPWWRLGPLQAPALDDRPDAWRVQGPVRVEVTLPAPTALASLTAELTTPRAGVAWSYRTDAQGDWIPLEGDAPPPDPVGSLRLDLTPSALDSPIGVRRVTLIPRDSGGASQ